MNDDDTSLANKLVDAMPNDSHSWQLGYLISLVDGLARDFPEVERVVAIRLGSLLEDRAQDAAHAAARA